MWVLLSGYLAIYTFMSKVEMSKVERRDGGWWDGGIWEGFIRSLGLRI